MSIRRKEVGYQDQRYLDYVEETTDHIEEMLAHHRYRSSAGPAYYSILDFVEWSKIWTRKLVLEQFDEMSRDEFMEFGVWHGLDQCLFAFNEFTNAGHEFLDTGSSCIMLNHSLDGGQVGRYFGITDSELKAMSDRAWLLLVFTAEILNQMTENQLHRNPNNFRAATLWFMDKKEVVASK